MMKWYGCNKQKWNKNDNNKYYVNYKSLNDNDYVTVNQRQNEWNRWNDNDDGMIIIAKKIISNT